MDTLEIDEKLVASARVARGLALEHCHDTANGDCAWYHGVWQYFRALGVMKSAGGSGAYFEDALRAMAVRGDVHQVLISGGADDAMSLLALAAFRDEGEEVDLTMVDRCETPLALARWSAERFGAAVTTRRSDILHFESPAPFDAIMTNSFLGAFSPDERPQLFARWASLLRPGGKILFTNRLRPGDGHSSIGFTAAQAEVFCTAVRRATERGGARLDLDPDTTEEWARDYTRRYRSYPVRTVEEVLVLLRSAGLEPDRVDTTMASGRSGQEAVSGPSVAERAEYVRVVATRR
jgi:SAM-dependent methyltransferase